MVFFQMQSKIQQYEKKSKINKSEYQSKEKTTKRETISSEQPRKKNENEEKYLRRNSIPFKTFCVTTICVFARKIIIIVVIHIILILVNGIRWQRYGIVAIDETQYKLLECTYITITVVSHTGHRDFMEETFSLRHMHN